MDCQLLAENQDDRAILAQILRRAGLAVRSSWRGGELPGDWLEQEQSLVVTALSRELTLQIASALERSLTVVPLLAIVDPLREEEEIELTDAGVDLVIRRPFSVRLLMAQARLLAGRGQMRRGVAGTLLSYGGLSLDPITRTATTAAGETVALSRLEYRLVHALMVAQGQTLRSEDLVDQIWGYGDVGSRSLVRGLVSRVRAKIEPTVGRPLYLVTVPGIGYRLAGGDR